MHARLLVAAVFLSLSTGTAAAQPGPTAEKPVTGSFLGRVGAYPPNLDGRTMASGERYADRAMIAAHSTIAFGTWLDVSDGNRHAVVQVKDRGPYDGQTILLVSGEAARRLGLGDDPAPMRVEILGNRPTWSTSSPAATDDRERSDAGDTWSVQIGLFRNERAADRMARRIEGARSERSTDDGHTVWRVYFGRFDDRTAALAWRDRLRGWGYDGFVRRVDD